MIAIFSLGSNLGDRLGYLRTGVEVLRAASRHVALSPVYETDPVGGPAQGPYLNAVLAADLAPDTDLRALLTAAEQRAGRVRERRWGPRTLDVDLVALAGEPWAAPDPELDVPHPRAAERAFVLLPWLDLDPAATLPGAGPVAALAATLDITGVRRRDDLSWDR